MPSIPDEYIPWRPGRPLAVDAAEPPAPGTLEMLGAAATMANWPYRSWRYMENREGVVTDPEHNPFDLIRGTKYEADPQRFAYSRNEQETRAIMSEWDADEAASSILTRSGRTGTAAAIGMGLLDPTIFLPVAKVFTGAAQGYRALRIAGDVALASAAGAAVGEAAMAVTTPGYGAGDAAIGIGSATLLGGLLGGTAGALLSRAERKALTKGLDADRSTWTADLADASPQAPQAAGAAASDTRELEMRNMPGTEWVPDPTGKIAPPRRVLNSGFATARRALVDLVETPYVFKENEKGIATTQGPALDRLVRLETGKARVAVAQKFDDAFTRYRFGGSAETWRESLSRKATLLGDHVGRPREKASFAEFKAMVDDALRNGDRHDIPEVAETAKFIRETVIAPWRDRAIKAGLLPEDVDVATAESYMIRVWNKQKLIGERPRAVQIFSDWLEGEEAKKAALQETVRDLKGRLDDTAGRIADLETAKVKKLGHEAELIDLKKAEATIRARIEEAVTQWEGRSTRSAKTALDRRAIEEGDRAAKIKAGTYGGRTFAGEADQRLTGADAEVDDAVRRMLAGERLRDRREIEALAEEIVDRIVGNPDGRMPYDAHTSPRETGPRGEARGPLAARDFMIPDRLVRDFIDTDAQNTAELYLNTMVPDVLLTERFGDVRMSEALRRLKDEAAAQQRAAKAPAEREKIKARYDATVADLAGMRDRIRGTYGHSSDPRTRFLGRMAQTAARYDVTTNLGGAALSSLPDLAGVQWQAGMTNAFRHAWTPFAKTLYSEETRRAVAAQKRQLRALGIAAETWLNTRTTAIHDVTDLYRPTSRFERGVKFAADRFGNVSLLAQWTDFGKLAAGMVSSGEFVDGARAIAAGKATKKQIMKLAENGIDAAMAERIVKALDAAGGADTIDGITIPNTGAWADRGAREAFEGAVARQVDLMIITPGAERPLMMSNPVAALILQYKSFVVAANERLLVRSLQTRDAAVLSGLASALALGVLSEAIYSWIVDRPLPKRPGDLIKAGVARSGMLGWYQEANALSEKWFGADAFGLIGAERPDSRYISREKLSAALGPTAGKVEAMIRTGANVADLNWTAADTRRMRRLLAGQNLFYIRSLLDRLEGGVNEAIGVQPAGKD